MSTVCWARRSPAALTRLFITKLRRNSLDASLGGLGDRGSPARALDEYAVARPAAKVRVAGGGGCGAAKGKLRENAARRGATGSCDHRVPGCSGWPDGLVDRRGRWNR